jgi:hypothetical protein
MKKLLNIIISAPLCVLCASVVSFFNVIILA